MTGEQNAGNRLARVGTGKELEKLKPKQKAFLQAIEQTGGRIIKSAQETGIHHNTHYKWLDKSELYREEFEKSFARSMDTLREEIIRRGQDGYDEEVYFQGKKVGTVKRYSDNLLMFEGKRRDPRYRDNYGQTGGLFGGANVKVVFNIPRPSGNEEIIDAESTEVAPDGEVTPSIEGDITPSEGNV